MAVVRASAVASIDSSARRACTVASMSGEGDELAITVAAMLALTVASISGVGEIIEVTVAAMLASTVASTFREGIGSNVGVDSG